MASSLDALLHKVVASRVAQLHDKPLGALMPVIDDLVIPTDDRQSSDDNAVFVSFTNSVRHLILRDCLGLPEWLKAHRTGDQSVVAVLVAADYTLPLSWCWDPLPAGTDESPVAQRIIMLTLRDGGGHVYLDRGNLHRTERSLPPSPTARWVNALYQCCCTYLSHTSPNTIIGADGASLEAAALSRTPPAQVVDGRASRRGHIRRRSPTGRALTSRRRGRQRVADSGSVSASASRPSPTKWFIAW